MIMGSPTLTALGMDVYGSLGECVRKRDLSVRGVELPNFKEYRRVSIGMEALLRCPQVHQSRRMRPSSDWFLAGPDMSVEPEKEERERAIALTKAVEIAATRLRKKLDRHWNAFRHGLRGDLPARVERMTVTLTIKTAWLATCFGTLAALRLVVRNMLAGWASAAMAAPKKGGFRLVCDDRAVNKQT